MYKACNNIDYFCQEKKQEKDLLAFKIVSINRDDDSKTT